MALLSELFNAMWGINKRGIPDNIYSIIFLVDFLPGQRIPPAAARYYYYS